ncbi:uncharacterized protein EV422DRAFT_513213 [Fimicolochytrium jonesii]|uniref:uncharacterized protein n=1 Tax=Fimicolochytrium jonesii TaxID=1396493 RepID=UPI0022FE3A0C|nr:uncharacterized protein EV422DRAFT_513213 [Fimicolochytrium jonesii]KAI8827256.1 hypothetical protein EV422DRAFT_513213 [Fimicolochytrium jonesii]
MVNLSAITRDIKFLLTVAFAVLGWLLTFIGLCVIESDAGGISGLWFHLFFVFFTIVAVITSVVTGSVLNYRTCLVALLAISFVYISDDLNVTLHETNPILPHKLRDGVRLTSAGLFFLSFAILPWIIFFGSSEEAAVNTLVNREGTLRLPSFRNVNGGQPAGNQSGPAPYAVDSTTNLSGATAVNGGNRESKLPAMPVGGIVAAGAGAQNQKAVALFPYEANPEDPSELSFVKGDQFDIVNNQGKWWQVRKSDGTVGIAPSNYLQLQ